MKQSTAPGPGASLRALRTLAGLTLEDVASQAAVSASYLSKVESGTKEASPVWIGRVSAIIARHLQATKEESVTNTAAA